MVESATLEMWYTRKGIVSSNLTPTAKYLITRKGFGGSNLPGFLSESANLGIRLASRDLA